MKKVLLALLMSVTAAGSASAMRPVTDPNRMKEIRTEIFDKMDIDKDGKVSRGEFLDYNQKIAGERFDKMEKTDKDFISKNEFMKFKPGFKGGKALEER